MNDGKNKGACYFNVDYQDRGGSWGGSVFKDSRESGYSLRS